MKEEKFIERIATEWYINRYGPKPKKDKTGGYYLVNKINNNHVHLVGPNGKFNPNRWSRKINVRRRWEDIDFRITPKEQAYHIYVKSGFRKEK